ncbi:uncharacterized protein LOC105849506 [Hydra vulgaris]|uniref:uncharacterized protein LOC105849506 n=1 Tax=Hydra vulgaris TaxID=6087 RepID=UPI0032E9C172
MKSIFWIAPELDTLVAIIKADRKRKDQDKTEDIAFLLDQLGDRKTRIGGIDTRYLYSVNRSLSKIKRKSNLHETMSESEFISKGSEKDEGNDDFSYPDPELKKKVKKTNTVMLPKDILKRTADTAVGEGISHRQHASMINSIIAKSGGNVAEFKSSTSTALRAADKVIHDESKRIKDDLRSLRKINKNILVQLHFDGKVCHEYTDGKKLEQDRLAILINANKETHLLGIPPISSGTGENQKNNQRWKKKNGAVSLLVNEVFQRPVLSIACRHYVNELHITHFWKNYQSSITSGPDNLLFKSLKSAWNDLDADNQVLKRLTIPEETWLGHQKHESITFCGNIITSGSLKKDGATRKDYIELAELTLMVLSEDRYKFRTPGAVHHARFMAKGIYYLKLQLMMDAIPSADIEFLNSLDFSGLKPPSLVHLVTENSWLLFLMIDQSKSDCQWMKTPPEYWTCNDFYLKFQEAVFNLSVVNDWSERIVKLIKDKIDIARKEEKRQDSL